MSIPYNSVKYAWQHVDTYRQQVLRLLTETAAMSPGAATAATFNALVELAHTSIGAAHTLLGDLPDGTRRVMFDNKTNGDVVVSMDAGVNDHYELSGGQTLTLPLASEGLVTTAIVHVKDGTSASTSGKFVMYSYG
jgi:hypothetical protein